MTSAFTTSPQSTCWWLVAAGNVNDTQYQSTSIMLSVRPLWRWTVWAIPASTILVQPTLQSKLKRVFVRKYYAVILHTIEHKLKVSCAGSNESVENEYTSLTRFCLSHSFNILWKVQGKKSVSNCLKYAYCNFDMHQNFRSCCWKLFIYTLVAYPA